MQQRRATAALKESLRSKPATGYRVGTITEDDNYGGDYRAGLYALSKRGLLRDGMTTDAFMREMRGDPDRDPGFRPRPKRKRG